MEVHEKGPKAPKSAFLQHPSAFTPSWPEGKINFLVMGLGRKIPEMTCLKRLFQAISR